MNTPDLAKLFSDTWPLLVGVLIGVPIVQLLLRYPPDIQRVRRQLGRALDHFADVPSTRLEPALLSAARDVQRGWRGVAYVLSPVVWVAAALFSSQLFRALFPELPHWLSFVVCGLVAGLLAWPIQRIERRALLLRLEHLHNAPGSA